ARSRPDAISPHVPYTTLCRSTFDNKNVGTGKTVSLSGATLAGAGKDNYSLASVTDTTANITAKPLTGSFTVSNKVYDGDNSATEIERAYSCVAVPRESRLPAC